MRDMAYDSSGGPAVYPEPERTSLAAILGFLLSLGGCCFGVTALLGLPMSILGAFNIGRSNGRLGGRALAVAGIVLGLMNLAVWGGCLGVIFTGVAGMEKQVLDPAGRTFLMLDQGQFDGARASMVSPGADLTDAELAAFTAAYQSTLGEFVSRPQGATNWLRSLTGLGPWESVMQSVGFGPGTQGTQGESVIPAIFTFQQGDALVLISIDPQLGQIRTLTVYDDQLNEYEMVLGKSPASGPASGPATTPNAAPDAIPDPLPADPAAAEPAP